MIATIAAIAKKNVQRSQQQRSLKAGFYMIAMIATIAEKNSSSIVAIDGFHMIAVIATIAEEVNED